MGSVQWAVQTKIGTLYLVASDQGLQGIHWNKPSVPAASSLEGSEPKVKILKQALLELEQYFSGDRKSFDVPLDLIGTDFQKKVWAELLSIPYGRTLSYREVAANLQNEKACRAVGTANGRNPVAIMVPCHRVIAADGTLGGYAGGLEIKSKLLALESRV